MNFKIFKRVITIDTSVTSVVSETAENITQQITSQPVETNVVDAISEKAEETATLFTKLSEMFSAKLPSLVFALIILVTGVVITKVILKAIKKMSSRSTLDKTANGFLHSFVSTVLYAIVIVMALNVLGVPMASIITVLGAAGLALSLALQQCLSNVAGGFIILGSKPFKVGDFIEINGVTGEVEGISVLYTKLLTPDNKLSYIPNGVAANEKITNYTVTQTRRLDLVFSISYENDFRKALEIISSVAAANPRALKNPQPVIRLTAHGSSSLDIDCKVWVKSSEYFDLRYDMMESVKEAFDENGIKIPYTQIDVSINK
ncbi:MAG: mechanosensitive ion channel family protein [Oscillospiraceae bacterium]|nr:mechanosensitive ion channel family protein [Oscillospiraceae bacterium]